MNANLKWTTLFNMTEGIYLVLALVKYPDEAEWGAKAGKQEGHFVTFDAWRDLFVIGPNHGVERVQPEDKTNEEKTRTFVRNEYCLISPLRVCKLVVATNRISETKFNTPGHYSAREEEHLNNCTKSFAGFNI